MKSKNLSENILRSVKSKGFKYIELPSVIEANHIVQRSGENFRKFIFSFTDQKGTELCLRPDLTIVSCLRYLEKNLKGKEKIFYSGQAYRKSQNKKDSIIRNQIGFEILGSKDEKKDDKEIINTSLKSIQNLKYSINDKKKISLERFIYSLGIRHIGLENAKVLSKHFGSFVKFKDLSKNNKYDDLLNIDGIGETQVNSIKTFFSNKTNLSILNELEKVLTINKAIINREDGLLKNQTFLVTGKLNGISRAEVKSLIEENSGVTVTTVSNKLNYLITGDKPTKRKVEKAKELNIKLINQDDFLKMLNKTR